jgi:phosphoglycerate kinase
MPAFRTLDDLGDVRGKVALVRVDFNVPMSEGAVSDATRIRASAPTILELADAGAKVLLLTAEPDGSAAKLADLALVVPAQTMASDRGAAKTSVLAWARCAAEKASLT